MRSDFEVIMVQLQSDRHKVVGDFLAQNKKLNAMQQSSLITQTLYNTTSH
jgi:hypothetical protein